MKDSMKKLFLGQSGLLTGMLMVTVMFGCQSLSFDPKGHTVPDSKWINLRTAGEYSGIWSNDDLSLNYKFVLNQSQLTISGSVRFTDRITNNYHTIQYFHMDALPIDATGKVLDMIGLTSVAGVNTLFGYSININTVLIMPSNAVAIALSYRGKAYGTQDGGIMDFWEYPAY